MLRLRDIMTTDVLTVGPETTVRDAMELLAARHVSGVPVVAGTTVLGVLSSTDLLAFAAGLPGVPTEHADDWPDDDPPGEPDAEDDDAVPSAVFFAALWEDAGAEVGTRFAAPDGPEWDTLGEHTVAEAMTHAVHALPPDADVTAAAELMHRLGTHRVLVVEDGALVGVVSAMDVTRAVADRRIERRTWVFAGHADGGRRGWR